MSRRLSLAGFYAGDYNWTLHPSLVAPCYGLVDKFCTSTNSVLQLFHHGIGHFAHGPVLLEIIFGYGAGCARAMCSRHINRLPYVGRIGALTALKLVPGCARTAGLLTSVLRAKVIARRKATARLALP